MTALGTVVRTNIHKVLADKAQDLVAAYYDPKRPFAGALFDDFGHNPSNRFTSDDLVAAGLLDVRFGPDVVRGLLGPDTGDIPKLLKKLAAKAPLWESHDLTPAYTLWASLTSFDGVGPTKASKLLARKRPHLMPILDSVIRDSLGLRRADSWKVLREVLGDADLRGAIDGLAPAGQTPSTLRLLDVAVWMRFSESTDARTVRQEFDLPVSKRPGKTR